MSWHECKVCGRKCSTDGSMFYRIVRHHFIPGRYRGLKEGETSDTGITQKILWVCTMCHSDIHSLTDDKFFKKYKKNRGEFIHRREK